MLRFNRISLFQFKNYQQSDFEFTERIIGVCGKNGIGKTNLLDGLYYCCFTRSYFTRGDAQNVHYGMQGFRIEGGFENKGSNHNIVCILRETGRKELYLDGEAYTRFSDHIGKFPCVMIAPDDVQIITGVSEDRRRFLDALLSQYDHQYLVQLIAYNKVLQQRNSLLKTWSETRRIDYSLLEVLNAQLVPPANRIFESRRSFLASFIPLVQEFYRRISGEDYEVAIEYESQLLKGSFDDILQQQRDRDLAMQRTSAGIHKDELNMLLNGNLFKNSASQGQRKSLLFALKLAEFETLKKNNGFSPLLLLDDVFEKLDQGRMQNLLQWVCRENDGQIIITDTHCQRLQNQLDAVSVNYQLIEL